MTNSITIKHVVITVFSVRCFLRVFLCLFLFLFELLLFMTMTSCSFFSRLNRLESPEVFRSGPFADVLPDDVLPGEAEIPAAALRLLFASKDSDLRGASPAGLTELSEAVDLRGASAASLPAPPEAAGLRGALPPGLSRSLALAGLRLPSVDVGLAPELTLLPALLEAGRTPGPLFRDDRLATTSDFSGFLSSL
jgi:hypothetical protein